MFLGALLTLAALLLWGFLRAATTGPFDWKCPICQRLNSPRFEACCGHRKEMS
jgi:hypothetical protein